MGYSDPGLKERKKFKIAFDARPAQSVGTGVATYSTNIIDDLFKLGKKYNFIFIINSKLEVSHINFPPNSEFIITSVRRDSWFLRDIWMQFILPKKLQHMGVHLFHQPDYFIPIRPVQFVLVTSFLDEIAFTPIDDRIIFSRLRVKYLIRQGSKNADAIITISDYVKRQLLNHLDIKPEKITTVWCNITQKYFSCYNKEIAISCRQKLNFDDDFILYFGGFIKRKNVELLLDAYKIILKKRNIRLVMAGRINKRITRKIENLGIKEMVKDFGFAEVEELKVLLDKCKIFVFPSSMEGFGLPVAEALAVGAPVVCSNNGSLPEIGGDAVNYFDGTKPSKLADAIFEVLNNSTLRETLKAKGPKRAQMFTSKYSVAKLSKLYNHLLESKFQYT
jgi:glycosyltransferase involved in cell wall biosynthesis